ncbi:response regulator [Phenylobacterium sp. 20VBR1]|uniref:histidine kinase n=1 Tax=Phenylobacterium glaciei TaxID=2803784 RepID=A0A941D1S1_9CAUL|nr:response regulator [Phenylobacterium glaciei]MBR7620675.1 response regulator [Phenylobacterium glaciei]
MAEAGISGWIGRLLRGLGRRLGDHAVAAAEADAATAQDRLREAIDLLPEGVVFLDAEGRYILWNKRYAEIYHRSADLFRPGAPFSETLKIGVARGDYPEAIGREEEWLAERMHRLMNPSGERHEQRISDGRWLMIEERRTLDGGVIGLRVDITAMKQQAEALEEALHRAEAASRAKTEFLADMSHELRTPLNGVLGLGQALAATELSDSQRVLLTDMVGSAQDLDGLVNGLLDYGDRARAADAAPGGGVTPSDVPALRVLAADDNPTNRKVVELMLGAAGAQVISVENGQQAVDAWRAGAFDVVLMDLRMPVMDGLDAIRAIRKAEGAGLPRAPIIVISANTSETDVEASAAAGADRHIGKPLRAEQLFEAISGVLD